MRHFFICIFLFIVHTSTCIGQEPSEMFYKYKSLPDRNYRDISKEIKTDIDSLLVNTIKNPKEKCAYIKDFKKRIKRINAFLIPNCGMTDSMNKDFENMPSYKEYKCDNDISDYDEELVVLTGPLSKSMIFDKVKYYINNNLMSFIIIIHKYDVTYFVHIEGVLNKQDIQRIVQSIERTRDEGNYRPAWEELG